MDFETRLGTNIQEMEAYDADSVELTSFDACTVYAVGDEKVGGTVRLCVVTTCRRRGTETDAGRRGTQTS